MALTELDKLVTILFARVGFPCKPPPELTPLAENLGADEVQWGDLGDGREDGLLEVVDDRILIKIRGDQRRARRRFTLAHEIGHLVLAQPDFVLTSMRRRSGLEDDERFCDAFAAALLMPRDWIEEQYAGRPSSLATLTDCSERTQTSLSASLLRLRGILGWRSSLLHWRRKGSRWQLVGTTAVPHQLRFRLSTTGEAQHLLDELKPNSSRLIRIPLGEEGSLAGVQMEVRAHRASVVGLVDLRAARRR